MALNNRPSREVRIDDDLVRIDPVIPLIEILDNGQTRDLIRGNAWRRHNNNQRMREVRIDDDLFVLEPTIPVIDIRHNRSIIRGSRRFNGQHMRIIHSVHIVPVGIANADYTINIRNNRMQRQPNNQKHREVRIDDDLIVLEPVIPVIEVLDDDKGPEEVDEPIRAVEIQADSDA